MFYAIVYIDGGRRLKLFAEGGYNREKKVYDPLAPDAKERNIGWCLEDDDAVWPEEKEALERFAAVAKRNAEHMTPIEKEMWPEEKVK